MFFVLHRTTDLLFTKRRQQFYLNENENSCQLHVTAYSRSEEIHGWIARVLENITQILNGSGQINERSAQKLSRSVHLHEHTAQLLVRSAQKHGWSVNITLFTD